MTRTYVVPDIHGMMGHLIRAVECIEQREPRGECMVIFLGDYIDRGPQSAGVVRLIRDGIAGGKPWVALKGNHEDLMAQSIVAHDKSAEWSWLQNGGIESIGSYAGDAARMQNDAEWMAALPSFYEDEFRAYVHAFAPEQFPLKDAPESMVLWTRYPRGADVGYRGKHVVHGHTPIKAGPELLQNRTNLDCGAVFYGRLVVGVFDDAARGGPVETFEVTGGANAV